MEEFFSPFSCPDVIGRRKGERKKEKKRGE